MKDIVTGRQGSWELERLLTYALEQNPVEYLWAVFETLGPN